MNISKQGIDLIKSFENLRLTAYLCPAGVWTIGYGHTANVRRGDIITEEQAQKMLESDLAWVERTIQATVMVPLSQNQYDALCSLIYNIGSAMFSNSTLLKCINNKTGEEAIEAQFKRWKFVNGRESKGLVNRRRKEVELWRGQGDNIF